MCQSTSASGIIAAPSSSAVPVIGSPFNSLIQLSPQFCFYLSLISFLAYAFATAFG
jgi:hypothetical protein